MSDGLKDSHRAALVAVIAANPRVDCAVLYGSRATGEYVPSSDVDIALFGDELTYTDLARMGGEMDELTVPQRVDLVLYHRIDNAALTRHIDQDGVVLYRRATADSAL